MGRVNEWTIDGSRLDDLLPKLRAVIEDESDLIIEHRYYLGSRAPNRFVCNDFRMMEGYVRDNAAPGDAFVIWRFEDCCRDDNIFDSAKKPDAEGRTPSGGAY
jgi:hypothetical protein